MFKNCILTLSILTLSMPSFAEPREIALCVVGTGLTYSGMYLMYKEKYTRSDEIIGIIVFLSGLAMILHSNGIVRASDRL